MDRNQIEKGLKVRREVMGDAYADAAAKAVDPFSQEFRELVNGFCWGEVWSRPGLDRKSRSLINLALLAAMNRPQELKLNVRGALNNGVTKEEIAETFIHTMVYCGVPAAMGGFRVAQEVFREDGK